MQRGKGEERELDSDSHLVAAFSVIIFASNLQQSLLAQIKPNAKQAISACTFPGFAFFDFCFYFFVFVFVVVFLVIVLVFTKFVAVAVAL